MSAKRREREPGGSLDMLTLAAVILLIGFSWSRAAPLPDTGRLTTRQYFTVVRDVPKGARVTAEDVGGAFGRVAGADSLVRRQAEVIGRFATRALVAGAPIYAGALGPSTPAPEDSGLALVPIVIRRGLLVGVAAGASVIFVRDSGGVLDASTGKPPYQGFPVQAVVPMPEDSASAAVIVRAPIAQLDALRRLTTAGWHPVVLGRRP